MPAVSMTVVDAWDGKPLAGVFVLFRAGAYEGTLTGHGGRGVLLFAAEAVTNEDGGFQIGKQEFSAYPFFLNTHYENPQMTIFKPGYVVQILHNERRIIAELEDVTTWMYDRQTIRLKRAATDEETAHAVYFAAENAWLTMSVPLCSWKRMPRFLVAVDRAADDWDRRRASLTSDLRFRSARRPLRDVLMNDELYAKKTACGSPKAFFEPYLR